MTLAAGHVVLPRRRLRRCSSYSPESPLKMAHRNRTTPTEGRFMTTQATDPATYEDPLTVRDLRVRFATLAARSGHVFDRTITTGCGPLSPAGRELNLVAHTGYVAGFALAAVLDEVEKTIGPEFANRLMHLVNDVANNGDDGRCADIWPDVEAKLAAGGVGTPQWDARIRADSVAASEPPPDR